MGRSPLFTAVAVLSLGLALAVNTTMFALVDSVLRPVLPYHESGPVFEVGFVGGNTKHFVSWRTRYDAVHDGLTSANAIGAYVLLPGEVQSGTMVEDHYNAGVSPEIFSILGVRPMFGRAFGPADNRADAAPGVIISFTLWTRFFQQRPLSQHLTLGVGTGRYEVIGVMPRGMHYPGNTDVWLPLAAIPTDSATRRIGPFPLVRLKPGATQDAAEAELGVVAAHLTAEYSPNYPFTGRLLALRGAPDLSLRGWRGTYGAMMETVLAVLLIACANLGTMLLARGMARRRELAIRVALGASPRAIISHVLTECAIIIVAGVAIGMLLTFWALYLLPHFATRYVPAIGDLEPVPSWRVFLFAVLAAAVTLALAGALPALRAAATDPSEPIKEGAGTTTGRIRDRYNPLIIVEVALSTALLMTAALFIIGVIRLTSFNFRYEAQRLQVAGLDVGRKALSQPSDVERFYDDMVERAARIPGAIAAATRWGDHPDAGIVYAEEGRSGDHWMNLNSYTVVSPSYLSTVGIPIVEGRDFEPGDRASATGVVIVDDSAARRLWPGLASPVGRSIKFGKFESPGPWLRVVGVARSVELQPRHDVQLPPEPQIYVVYGHDAARTRALIVRGANLEGPAGVAALALAIRREVQAAAPWMHGVGVHRWLEQYENARQTGTFMATLFSAFGGFGLMLCAVGLYGVLAYTVNRRMRELAMRVALGAQARDVARVVVHDAAVTVLAGIAVGAFLALEFNTGIALGMFTVHYELVLALVAAELVLFTVALVACIGPVRQAVRADPAEILRAS